MQIDNSYNIASSAINRGLQNINDIAQSIAENSIPGSGVPESKTLVENIVELKEQSQQVKANVKVIETLKEIDDFLIDIMA